MSSVRCINNNDYFKRQFGAGSERCYVSPSPRQIDDRIFFLALRLDAPKLTASQTKIQLRRRYCVITFPTMDAANTRPAKEADDGRLKSSSLQVGRGKNDALQQQPQHRLLFFAAPKQTDSNYARIANDRDDRAYVPREAASAFESRFKSTDLPLGASV